MKKNRLYRSLFLTLAFFVIGVRNAFSSRADQTPQFANIGEGQSSTGCKSYFPDAALANRFMIVKIGSDQYHCAATAATTDIPLGIAMDSADAANLDVPINIGLLGCMTGTGKVLLGGTVAAGDFLATGAAGTAVIMPTTTGTWYRIGRALSAGVSGDVIEFAHEVPGKYIIP